METIRAIAIILLIPLLAFLIYQIAIWEDSGRDRQVCGNEFANISGVNSYESYANNDFWKINNGRNIHCTVFWTGKYLTHVDFISGTLTKGMIDNSIYW